MSHTMKHSVLGLFYNYRYKTLRPFSIQRTIRELRRYPDGKSGYSDQMVPKNGRASSRVYIKGLDNPDVTQDLRFALRISNLRYSSGYHLYDQCGINCLLLFYDINQVQRLMIAVPGSPRSANWNELRYLFFNSNSRADRIIINSHVTEILGWLHPRYLKSDVCLIWQED